MIWGAGRIPAGRANPEPGGEIEKIEHPVCFRFLGDASDANDTKLCIISITKCSEEYLFDSLLTRVGGWVEDRRGETA